MSHETRFRWSELPLLLAIFLDLAGFGMAFPDIQLRAEALGASGVVIGLLLSSYFAVQFVASPLWGRLSDRVGRKPVLAGCTLLSALSMVAYASMSSLVGILISRMLAGFAAANVVVGQAYVADTSTDAQRSARMGRMSAALTAGLVAGPALGGWLASTGGSERLGWAAATASGLSFLSILLFVPGRPPVSPRTERRPVFDWRILGEFPALRGLFFLASASWFAMACLEGTFGRLIKARLGYGQMEFGIVFSWESLVGVAAGVAIARLVKRYPARTLLQGGYVLLGVGVALMPFAGPVASFLLPDVLPYAPLQMLLVFSLFSAFGFGVANPMLSTLCSNATPEDRQGEMFGLLQAARSVGFFAGPMVGGLLFDWQHAAPYLLAGGVAIVSAVLASSLAREAP